MDLASRLRNLHDVTTRVSARVDWLPKLLRRATLGLVFAVAGWGKVHNLDSVREYFASLHIPWPGFNATLVGYTELVCGGLLLVGLLSRVAAVPLLISMTVAIFAARMGDVHDIADFAGLLEWAYVVLLLSVIVAGPGPVSLDHLIRTTCTCESGSRHMSLPL